MSRGATSKNQPVTEMSIKTGFCGYQPQNPDTRKMYSLQIPENSYQSFRLIPST